MPVNLNLDPSALNAGRRSTASNDPSNFSPNNINDGSNSPSPNLKLTFPKRKYSLQRNDSLIGLPTPTFDPKNQRTRKKGPSSRNTVLTMAGLFVIGLTLLLSGFIVLIQHRETPFIITGCSFIGVALLMLIIVVVVQRKNVIRLAHQLDQDLYFLNISSNPMWKLMLESLETDEIPPSWQGSSMDMTNPAADLTNSIHVQQFNQLQQPRQLQYKSNAQADHVTIIRL